MDDVKLPRREVLKLIGAAAALPALSRTATAQTYPDRPVRIICGFPPGGISDTYARLMAQWLSQQLGQQFIVENRPGAGATLAAEAVAKSAPDGYTLLQTTSADAWNATLYQNLNFDIVRDFSPIGTISRGSGLLVVNPSLPVQSVPELIAYAKSNPGKVTMASAARRTCSGNCSAPRPGSTWCMCRIGAAARPWSICSAARSRPISAPSRRRSNRCGQGNCAPWR